MVYAEYYATLNKEENCEKSITAELERHPDVYDPFRGLSEVVGPAGVIIRVSTSREEGTKITLTQALNNEQLSIEATRLKSIVKGLELLRL